VRRCTPTSARRSFRNRTAKIGARTNAVGLSAKAMPTARSTRAMFHPTNHLRRQAFTLVKDAIVVGSRTHSVSNTMADTARIGSRTAAVEVFARGMTFLLLMHVETCYARVG